MVKAYLKQRYNKPGNVYLGIPHRLDRPVSGVVVFARNTKAAGRLAEAEAAFGSGNFELMARTLIALGLGPPVDLIHRHARPLDFVQLFVIRPVPWPKLELLLPFELDP